MIRTANRVFSTSFSQSTIDDHQVVAALPGRKVRVIGYYLISEGTNTVQFVTGTPTDEVQTVTIGGGPTGGTFTLTYDGQTTAGIAYNAAASAVTSALEALSNIAAGEVTTTGSAGGPWTVTFALAQGSTNVAQMTASAAGLTGGTTPTVTVATVTGGVAGTAITPALTVANTTQLRDRGTVDSPCFASGDGEGLYIKLTAAQALKGYVTYTHEASS